MRYFLLALFALLALSAQAHQLSTAYLSGEVSETGRAQLEMQIRLYDLERVLGLDANADGELLWGEVLDRAEAIESYLQSRIALARGDQACKLSFVGPWKVDRHYNEGYLLVYLQAQCPLKGEVQLSYSAFFDYQPEHKLLVRLRNAGEASVEDYRIMGRHQQNISLFMDDGSVWLTLKDFVKEGVIHIWIGLDHILFLLSLLLTCILTRSSGQWRGEPAAKRVISNTVWIVTAFTLAHSVTLTATALGWVQVSSRWVEVAIALSVALAALNNIFPVVRRLSGLTFVFGLIHGFGFAGVLGELGVPADQTVPAVLAFNLGVELGQLVIVMAVLPCLMAVRHYRWFPQMVMPITSLAIAGTALYWVITRL